MLREIDLMRVVGKEKPVAIFELMTDGNSKLADGFSEALKVYRAKGFQNALDIFTGLLGEHSDPVAKLYAERCREYLQMPPPPDWDGVFISIKK